MKSIALGIATVLAAVTMSSAEPTDSNIRAFEKVKLTPPLNWQAGKSLFPGRVIAGYNAELDKYDSAEAWASYVLKQCKGEESCTSAFAFQATNSGDEPKTRFWFGYAFSGAPTTEKNYVRNKDVSGSIVYTIVLKNDSQENESEAAGEL